MNDEQEIMKAVSKKVAKNFVGLRKNATFATQSRNNDCKALKMVW